MPEAANDHITSPPPLRLPVLIAPERIHGVTEDEAELIRAYRGLSRARQDGFLLAVMILRAWLDNRTLA
jgi:hypothetical protein